MCIQTSPFFPRHHFFSVLKFFGLFDFFYLELFFHGFYHSNNAEILFLAATLVINVIMAKIGDKEHYAEEEYKKGNRRKY